MAVIQKLRGSGVVVIVIIAALIIFVIGDILTGRNSGRGAGSDDINIIGEVFGEKITNTEKDALLQKTVKDLQERDPNFDLNSEENIRGIFNGNQNLPGIWTELVDGKMMPVILNKAGIAFSEFDLTYNLTGEHPYSQLTQIPDFQTNGKFDGKKAESLYKQAKSNPGLKKYFENIISIIKKDVPKNRYYSYISKSWFTPKTVDQYKYVATVQGSYGKMVSLPLTTIADKDVKVTDEDIQNYIDENKGRFKQEQSRDIQFVAKSLIPSAKDTADAIKEANAFATSFKNKATTDTTVGQYIKKVNLHNPQLVNKDTLLSKVFDRFSQVPVGELFGPVFDGKSQYFVMRKTAQTKDTAGALAKIRHILISTRDLKSNKKPLKDSLEAFAFAQELLGKIQKGEPMAKLASEFSTDGNAAQGGVYDWTPVNNWVPEFKKFASTHKKGDIGIVKTTFGYHVMRMEEDPDDQLVSFVFERSELTPGAETIKAANSIIDRIYAASIGGNAAKFEKAIETEGKTDAEIKVRLASGIKTDNLGINGIESRDLVRSIYVWIFDKSRKVGEVSRFTNDKTVALVRLEAAKEDGTAKPADVRAKVEPIVRNQKKAKMLKEKFDNALKSAKNVDALAAALKTTVTPINKVSQNASGFTLSNENIILGVICGQPIGKMSTVIEGNQNVAVVIIDKRDDVDFTKATNLTKTQGQMDMFFSNLQFLPRLLDAPMKKMAEIKDYRYKQDNSGKGWVW